MKVQQFLYFYGSIRVQSSFTLLDESIWLKIITFVQHLVN